MGPGDRDTDDKTGEVCSDCTTCRQPCRGHQGPAGKNCTTYQRQRKQGDSRSNDQEPTGPSTLPPAVATEASGGYSRARIASELQLPEKVISSAQNDTMSMMYLVATVLVVTSVDACGPPPRPCDPLHCRFVSWNEFHNATCIPAAEKGTCDGWINVCRCNHDQDPVCCHKKQCEEMDAIQNQALLGAENFQLIGFPPQAQLADLGSNRGMSVSASGGEIAGLIRINFPKPFKLYSVNVATNRDTVTSFSYDLTHTGGSSNSYVVMGGYEQMPENTVVDAIDITNFKVEGQNNFKVFMQLSLDGCLDPACEEAGGYCMEQLPENTGACVVPMKENGEHLNIPGIFYDGSGFGCSGKISTIKCCRPAP